MARRSQLTDDEIVARARPVFVERGEGARTRQIAAAVGLTWGAITRRFGSKRALMERALAPPEHGLGCSDIARPGPADLHGLLQRLHAYLGELWPRRLQNRPAAAAAGAGQEPEPLLQQLAALLAEQARRRVIRSDLSPDLLARLLLALATGDVVRRFAARQTPSAADPAFSDGVVRLLSA